MSIGRPVIEGHFAELPQAPIPFHQAAAQPVRRLPRRVVEITLPAPYDDFHVTAWVNFPKRVLAEMNSKDEARTRAALCQIVTAHDLVDEDGNDYPPATEPDFWGAIPDDLGAIIVGAVVGRIGKLDPKP